MVCKTTPSTQNKVTSKMVCKTTPSTQKSDITLFCVLGVVLQTILEVYIYIKQC
jgi:nitrate reductase NapE component